MTPSKEKKPLPRRRRRRSSIILQPASFKHWHHRISCLRLLLLKGLFAEVVVRCNTLLFEPAIANVSDRRIPISTEAIESRMFP